MLAVFHGNDTVKVRQAALHFAESSVDGASPRLIESGEFEPGLLESLAGEASLFGGRSVYLLDTPSANKEFLEAVIVQAEALQNSNQVFVVIEGALLADPKKKLTKHAACAEEYKSAAGERFNGFSLADALSKRDKKLLWLLWNEALRNGLSPEEIVGILWWQLKTLRLAAIGQTAAEVGLKDFPYKKAKAALAKFKPGELEDLSRSLLSLAHESRLGRQDIQVSLERWILRI